MNESSTVEEGGKEWSHRREAWQLLCFHSPSAAEFPLFFFIFVFLQGSLFLSAAPRTKTKTKQRKHRNWIKMQAKPWNRIWEMQVRHIKMRIQTNQKLYSIYLHIVTATTTTAPRHNGLLCYCYDCKKKYETRKKEQNKQLTTKQIFCRFWCRRHFVFVCG